MKNYQDILTRFKEEKFNGTPSPETVQEMNKALNAFETKWIQSMRGNNDRGRGYVDPSQNAEYQEAKKAATMKRNALGIPLFSPECEFCKNHYELSLRCYLCGLIWVYRRQHITVKNNWDEELTHHCAKGKRYLSLILEAVNI